MTLVNKTFENIVGKGKNAGNQHFVLFPQCFLPFTKQIPNFHLYLFSRLHMLLMKTSLKCCRWALGEECSKLNAFEEDYSNLA